VSETVQTAPVNEVTAIGSKAPAPVAAPVPLVQQGGGGCDPNYTGACVPIASDVDCAGGSGNGPAYVQGPVRVVGSDIYDLDRDGDGIACD
jgi:resuscitation-promoting factor RpfB